MSDSEHVRDGRLQPAATARGRPRGRIRLGAVVAVLVAIGFVVWALVEDRSGAGGASPDAGTNPVALSAAGLSTLTAALPKPVYWVGARPDARFEYSRTTDGKTFVRYLPRDAKAGDRRTFLTVATYPMANAFGSTRAASEKDTSVVIPVRGGAVAFAPKDNDTNAYVAFPGADVQIEVFDPRPGNARRFVRGGAVARVPATSPEGTATKVTPSGLKTLAASLGRPVYWAGVIPGRTLELSNAAGRIYVRYLPAGADVGDPGKYLTIGTYPFDNAFAATSGVGARKGMEAVALPGGGVAVYSKARSAEHVYVAYQGVPYQIEVYDPTPERARKLATSGQIVPAG